MPEPSRRPPGAQPPPHLPDNPPVPEPGPPIAAPEAGRAGRPDPTRYGDWEIKGVAVDF